MTILGTAPVTLRLVSARRHLTVMKTAQQCQSREFGTRGYPSLRQSSTAQHSSRNVPDTSSSPGRHDQGNTPYRVAKKNQRRLSELHAECAIHSSQKVESSIVRASPHDAYGICCICTGTYLSVYPDAHTFQKGWPLPCNSIWLAYQ